MFIICLKLTFVYLSCTSFEYIQVRDWHLSAKGNVFKTHFFSGGFPQKRKKIIINFIWNYLLWGCCLVIHIAALSPVCGWLHACCECGILPPCLIGRPSFSFRSSNGKGSCPNCIKHTENCRILRIDGRHVYRVTISISRCCFLMDCVVFWHGEIGSRGDDTQLTKGRMEESWRQFPCSNLALLRPQQPPCKYGCNSDSISCWFIWCAWMDDALWLRWRGSGWTVLVPAS